jgi:hypothetical protein
MFVGFAHLNFHYLSVCVYFGELTSILWCVILPTSSCIFKVRFDLKQLYLKTHFYSPPRPLGGGAQPSQANSESGSGQQQAHSSFTAASHKHVAGQQPLETAKHTSAPEGPSTAEFAAFEEGTGTL